MDNEKHEVLQIPFLVHEQQLVRAERTQARLTIIAVTLVIAIVASNLYWIVRVL